MDLTLHKNNSKYIDIKVEIAWKHNFSDILLMVLGISRKSLSLVGGPWQPFLRFHIMIAIQDGWQHVPSSRWCNLSSVWLSLQVSNFNNRAMVATCLISGNG